MSCNAPSVSYTVRVSSRARHVRLSITSSKGLEVIVPRGFDQHRIPAILRAKKDWIAKHLERSHPWQGKIPTDILPDDILFRAIGQHWTVRHVPARDLSCTISETGKRELSLSGPDRHVPAMLALLERWLILQGKIHLPPWLEQMRQKHGLPRFSRVQVRNQKTRWGSCSAKGTISLNAKLLFIAPELVEYILIHELCHLVHLDHSPSFWNTVNHHMTDFRTHESQLKQAWIHVPAWAGM
ncbi:M48 family metallopeptidase [Desulfoplanes formicivorans]|uniref:M48 family metallopeptidase n=1 Tax=Desulfoplanes formicivorans TaxID=1592317 RepID=UPI000852C9F1|nr:SprT family zinc-dependent metalloprotease [Desulfoplanes formicivorans]